MNNLGKNYCPICGKSDFEISCRKRYYLRDNSLDFYVKQCDFCTGVFQEPIFPLANPNSFYDNDYYVFKQKNINEFLKSIPMYFRTIPFVKNTLSKKKILEVGCGKGYLLSLLKNLGWEIQGVEISAFASYFAKEVMNLDVFCGNLGNFPEMNDYPLILLVDVLEHIKSPGNFLNKCKNLLSRNGKLIIDTPNTDSINFNEKGVRWGGLNPFHLVLYNKKSLIYLLESQGFSIRKIFSYNNEFILPKDGYSQKSKQLMKNLLQKMNMLEFFSFVKRNSKSPILFILYFLERLYFNPSIYVRYFSRIIRKLENDGFDYFESSDSQSSLATKLKGDNLVVIAEK
jgi:2-polyprenyl-3-methyl-5-hydroxy-6-metoxy-1,4-benzoquinol methylase